MIMQARVKAGWISEADLAPRRRTAEEADRRGPTNRSRSGIAVER